MFHVLSLSLVIVIADEAHYCWVVCKLHNVVSSEPSTAVVSHQCKQQWTQDTALGGISAQGDDTGDIFSHLHIPVLNPRVVSLFLRVVSFGHWYYSRVQQAVKNVCETPNQLVSTFLKHLS